MIYNSDDFTWGYEVEWGNIDRTLPIPPELGKWEYAETDILNLDVKAPVPFPDDNLYPPLTACDPLGLQPAIGGEVNMRPTKTFLEQVDQIIDLKEFFMKNGDKPTASLVNHGHLHVFVPGLKDDIDALKRLIQYIQTNQHVTVNECYKFFHAPDMKKYKGATTYLKYDGGRLMPDYMCDNIINLATDFDHFIKLHAAGKDGVSMGRPFRYAINTYCMKHTGTIEFRCFRSSTRHYEILNQFRFVEQFMDAALNGGRTVKEILEQETFEFPRFYWNPTQYKAWIDTKYDKSRGQKKREYVHVS